MLSLVESPATDASRYCSHLAWQAFGLREPAQCTTKPLARFGLLHVLSEPELARCLMKAAFMQKDADVVVHATHATRAFPDATLGGRPVQAAPREEEALGTILRQVRHAQRLKTSRGR